MCSLKINSPYGLFQFIIDSISMNASCAFDRTPWADDKRTSVSAQNTTTE
jgi:hypothetical protein